MSSLDAVTAGPRPHSLARLLAPRSIAVVGASASPEKAGGAMMTALDRFPGALYPVNPRATEIAGRRAYPALADVPEPVDLAVLVLPAAAAVDVVEQCAAHGVGGAVVCAGGFGESGADGAVLERRLADVARAGGVRLLGPNTSGFMNPAAGVSANFMPAAGALRHGPVAIVAQSGGVNLALSFLRHGDGGGISLAAGLGNAVDVGFAELLDHLREDEATRVVALHVEGVADGRALVEAVRRTVEEKPVVVLKIGRTDVSDFAQSHTGALTGDWALTRAALAQAGAVVVDTPLELVDAAAALSRTRLAPKRRPGVAVVTGQAGPGLIVADQLASAGVAIPPLPDATVQALGTLLPPGTYQRNPVDTGRPERSFPDVLAAVGAAPEIDCVLVYTLQEAGTGSIVNALVEQRGGGTLPPAVFVTGGLEADTRPQRDALEAAGIPTYLSPDRGASAVRALVADAIARARLAEPGANGGAAAAVVAVPTAGPLDEAEAKGVLAATGLRFARGAACDTRAQAHAALERLGAPVVVKLLDARVLHKSDIGAVHVNVATAGQLDSALDAIDAAAPGEPRYLVEQQAEPGVELILGGVRDACFGPTVVLGLGGIDVGVGVPPAVRVAPLGEADAREMVAQLPEAVRAGSRGRPPLPAVELAAAIVAFGDLLAANPHVAELEINPVRVTAAGLIGLDALIVLDSHESRPTEGGGADGEPA